MRHTSAANSKTASGVQYTKDHLHPPTSSYPPSTSAATTTHVTYRNSLLGSDLPKKSHPTTPIERREQQKIKEYSNCDVVNIGSKQGSAVGGHNSRNGSTNAYSSGKVASNIKSTY